MRNFFSRLFRPQPEWLVKAKEEEAAIDAFHAEDVAAETEYKSLERREPVLQLGDTAVSLHGDTVFVEPIRTLPVVEQQRDQAAAALAEMAGVRPTLNRMVRESVGTHGELRIARVVDPTDTGALSAAMSR